MNVEDEGVAPAAPSSRVRGLDEADLLLVARRWERRGAHSSVERFLDWFPDARKLTTDDLRQRPDRLLHLVAAAARHDGYTIWGVELEARVVGRSLTRRTRPRLVHFLYGDHDVHFSPWLLGRLGVRTVATMYFSVEELDRRLPRKRHLRHMDLVLATGAAQQEHLAAFVAPERLGRLPLGVDTAFFRPDPCVAPVPGRLLQVGANRRDLETLRVAVDLLRRDRPELTVHFVGCDEAAAVFAEVPGVLVEHGLTDEQLRHAYRQAELVVLPLAEGGSSNALNEALSSGTPVVATDRPNLVDYADPACVTLVAPGDPAAFASACRDLLDDPARRQRAGEAARRHALGYDWSVVRERLLDHYEAVLAR